MTRFEIAFLTLAVTIGILHGTILLIAQRVHAMLWPDLGPLAPREP